MGPGDRGIDGDRRDLGPSVVAKLAEAVLVVGDAMGSKDAGVHFASRPVADDAAGMEQRLQQPNDAVIVWLEAGHAPTRLLSVQ